MAYTPKTWQCGETIMADDLNHMEQGIAQGGSEPLIVHSLQMTAEEMTEAGLTGVTVGDAYRLDATSDAIEAALTSGRAVLYIDDEITSSLILMMTEDNLRYFKFITSIIRAGDVYGVTWEEAPGYAYPIQVNQHGDA